MGRLLRWYLPRLLVAVTLAFLLALGFVYVPRKNLLVINSQIHTTQHLSQSLSSAEGFLKSINTTVTAQSYGSARALAAAYDSASKELPADFPVLPPKLLSLPWNSKTNNYDSLVGQPGYTKSLKAAARALKADKGYMEYQAAVWEDLANFVEYPAAQDLADPATVAQNQAAAGVGTRAVIQKLKSLPGYDDPAMGGVKSLLGQAEASSSNDAPGDFIVSVGRIQSELIINRQNFTARENADRTQATAKAIKILGQYLKKLDSK